MGWSDGKGLGKNNHGNVDAVKLNANHSGKGRVYITSLCYCHYRFQD